MFYSEYGLFICVELGVGGLQEFSKSTPQLNKTFWNTENITFVTLFSYYHHIIIKFSSPMSINIILIIIMELAPDGEDQVVRIRWSASWKHTQSFCDRCHSC